MTAAQTDLWTRIDAFEIDGREPVALPFTARLAREHGWTRDYAARVVREYKRFVFLAMTAGEPVCPSEDVDAAWHMHLTYTRSYWQRFCGETLGKPLHHDPTRGGPAEAGKHLRMYEDTLSAYRRAFGSEPPEDVWPPAVVRFGDDLRHVVVNTHRNWVVPKAWVGRFAAAVAVAVTAVAAGTGANGLNPFELVGAEYLLFLIPLMLFSLAIGLVVRKVRKGNGFAGEPPPELTWEQAAYLAGGHRRLMSGAIARLVQTGAARVSADGEKIEAGNVNTAGLTPVEQEIISALPLRRSGDKGVAQLAERVKTVYATRADKLSHDGLTLSTGSAMATGFLSALPLFAVIVLLGLPRLLLGLANGKPVAYLVATLVVGVVAGIVLLAARPTRTRKGDEALARLRTDHSGLGAGKRWGDAADAGLAVALFGTTALVGTEYALLQRWYPRQSSADGGCGSGCGTGGCGGGGGGGCGGGGCGGCGGGGGD
jgi:uncharacterized protein (TIGR04222 family)